MADGPVGVADARLPPLPAGSRRPVANAFLAVGAMVGASLVLGIAVVLVAAVLGFESGTHERQALAAVDVLISLGVTLGALLWFARRRAGWSVEDLGLRRTPGFWWSVGVAIACYVGYLVVAAMWVAFVGATKRGHDLLEVVGERPPFVVTAIIVVGACVGAPLVEELLFRGFLFRALTSWRGHLVGALVSSAVFGVLHGLSVAAKMLPVLATLGFFLCVLYRRTGSILPGMGLHAFQNSLATGVALGLRWWTVALMAGSWATIWLVLTPWRRAAALPRPVPPASSPEGRLDRNAALPDWARPAPAPGSSPGRWHGENDEPVGGPAGGGPVREDE